MSKVIASQDLNLEQNQMSEQNQISESGQISALDQMLELDQISKNSANPDEREAVSKIRESINLISTVAQDIESVIEKKSLGSAVKNSFGANIKESLKFLASSMKDGWNKNGFSGLISGFVKGTKEVCSGIKRFASDISSYMNTEHPNVVTGIKTVLQIAALVYGEKVLGAAAFVDVFIRKGVATAEITENILKDLSDSMNDLTEKGFDLNPEKMKKLESIVGAIFQNGIALKHIASNGLSLDEVDKILENKKDIPSVKKAFESIEAFDSALDASKIDGATQKFNTILSEESKVKFDAAINSLKDAVNTAKGSDAKPFERAQIVLNAATNTAKSLTSILRDLDKRSDSKIFKDMKKIFKKEVIKPYIEPIEKMMESAKVLKSLSKEVYGATINKSAEIALNNHIEKMSLSSIKNRMA